MNKGWGRWCRVGRVCDHQELQVLVSWASIPIDVSYLRRRANYSGKLRVEEVW